MHTRSKHTLAALAATLIMSVAVSAAHARNLSTSNQNIRIAWSALTFYVAGSVEASFECPVTLEGSFHYRTIVKSQGALIGSITRASLGPPAACTGGTATLLTETLPWHLTYDSFTGTLPRITSVRLLLHTTAFVIEVVGFRCLYAEDGVERARAIAILEAGGAIAGLEVDRRIRVPLLSGTFVCPPDFSFEGTGTVTLLGTTTGITVTLI